MFILIDVMNTRDIEFFIKVYERKSINESAEQLFKPELNLKRMAFCDNIYSSH